MLSTTMLAQVAPSGAPGKGAANGKGVKAAAASSSPSASAATTPTTTNAQSGYVYRLKWRYHIKYGSKKITVQEADEVKGPIITNTITTCKEITFLDTTAELAGHKDEERQREQPYKGFPQDKKTDCTVTKEKTCGTKDCTDKPFHNLITTINEDSVSRYLNLPRSISNHHRLHVAIGQQDSGKLIINIKRRLTNTDVASLNAVWGINYKGDKNVVDIAKPLSAEDSVNNFYLQIKNKATIGDKTYFISIPYTMLQYGAVTIPFKFRWPPHTISKTSVGVPYSTPSESSASFNVAAYVGKKWGRTRFYFDGSKTHNTMSAMVSFFAGPSLVSLSSTNVDSSIDLSTKASSILAFSVGPAATLEWRSINFGIFGGWDMPFQSKTGWVYKGRFWFGFGIGVNLGMFTSANSQ